ncbi:DUF3575 domain-containing protein [Oscillatoria amoena NRMC-F 0135]|nr:DUF3575 domain-containing protein [Oscillatoria amoena NRMC-F 0135]
MRYLIPLFLLLLPVTVLAQQKAEVARKNTIKVDLTSYWLYRNAIVFSYERVMKPHQTLAVTAGYQQLPPLGFLGSDSVNVQREANASGLKLGAEYRFYLARENKYNAPRGVYIGPYFSYHNYTNGRILEVTTNGTPETVTLDTDLNILNVGVQLGYQFVLNNRWAIDLVLIGPSASNYSIQTKLGGNYSFDPEDVKNEVIQAMIDRFPAFEQLLSEKEFEGKGKISTWSAGYRYQFQIGYHFGRKKK